MHIPDGYLSLQTALPAAGVMIPIWKVALDKIKKTMNHRQIPMLALCAAYSFVIMMFNVPLGESSVHAVGAVFIAILLGPWAACIAVSIALIIQAVVFGDGGILALGANCFNMAVAMPFIGYGVYRLIAGKTALLTSKRGRIATFVGAWAGINAAAFFTAVEFGIQPLLFKSAEGVPLFGYFPLSVSLPVMMLEHTVVAGPIEGILTVAAIGYVVKFAPHLIQKQNVAQTGEHLEVLDMAELNQSADSVEQVKDHFKTFRPLLIGLGTLILLTPLGLYATGTAWGEWSAEELKSKIGYVPQGLAKFSDLWQSALPGYSIPGVKETLLSSSSGYILSAVVGIGLISATVMITSKLLIKPKGGL